MTTASEIAKVLKKPKKNGDGSWIACCPAHNDKTPSLSISDADNDKILWKCHAGCTQDEVQAALTDLGVFEPREEHQEHIQPPAFTKDYPSPRQHIYRNEKGKPIFVVERQARPEGGKTFRQHGINSHTMEGIERIPYQLHHWHDHKAIIICEGEQGVEALNKYGYPATTNPGGAGNWQSELNQYFADKDVYIIPDNDEPGRKHALNVAEQLHKVANTIIISNVCSNLNDKDDIIQWLQSNNPKTLLNELTKFLPWALGEKIEDQDVFNVYDYTASAWLQKTMEPRDYLMGTLLCTTSRWMVYAPTGLGKTLFTLNMMAAISAGQQFLNWKGGHACRVMYIDGEMPAETFKERIVQVTSLYGADIDLVGINRDDQSSNNLEMPPLNTEDGVEWLKHKIKYVRPAAIAFDSIMCLLSGDMKDEESWEPIKSLMKWLTNQRIAQIWVHHTGHAQCKSYSSNTREWELDTVLRLDRPPNNEEGFILNFTKNRLKTFENAEEFDRVHCKLTDSGWVAEQSIKEKTKKGDDRTNYAEFIEQAYSNLAQNAVENHTGHDGSAVRAIKIAEVRRWIVDHGLIPPKDDGGKVMSDGDRKVFSRAVADLNKIGRFAGNSDSLWRI